MKLPTVFTLTAMALCAGCMAARVILAPGAGAVVLTQNPADVLSCHPVGSVNATFRATPAPEDQVAQLRNQALGLGADTVFITSTDEATFSGGVAYRCKAPAGS